MTIDMFAELLGNEDKASVFMKDPNLQYQTEINAWITALTEILIRNGMTTFEEFEKLKEIYIARINDATKKEVEKQLNELID